MFTALRTTMQKTTVPAIDGKYYAAVVKGKWCAQSLCDGTSYCYGPYDSVTHAQQQLPRDIAVNENYDFMEDTNIRLLNIVRCEAITYSQTNRLEEYQKGFVKEFLPTEERPNNKTVIQRSPVVLQTIAQYVSSLWNHVNTTLIDTTLSEGEDDSKMFHEMAITEAEGDSLDAEIENKIASALGEKIPSIIESVWDDAMKEVGDRVIAYRYWVEETNYEVELPFGTEEDQTEEDQTEVKVDSKEAKKALVESLRGIGYSLANARKKAQELMDA